MARYGSADVAYFLIDGYDPTDVTTEFTSEIEAILEEITAYGDDWTRHAFVGVKNFELTQNGFFDDAANSVNAALHNRQGDERIVSFALADGVLGSRALCYRGALQVDYNIIATVKELTRANARYAGNGAADACLVLAALLARTADAPGASIDNGAATLVGGVAFLQVPAINLDGAAKVIVRVEDSANDLDFATIATFADVTARSAQAVAIAGTIRQYVRAVWEFDGGGAAKSVTFAVMVRRY